MKNQIQTDQFNEMMQVAYEEQKERLAGQPDGHEGEPQRIDQVSNPNHYDICDTTVNDIIKKAFTHKEYMGWLKGNVIKYRLRAGKKNALQNDIDKANEYEAFYQQYLLENTP